MSFSMSTVTELSWPTPLRLQGDPCGSTSRVSAGLGACPPPPLPPLAARTCPRQAGRLLPELPSWCPGFPAERPSGGRETSLRTPRKWSGTPGDTLVGEGKVHAKHRQVVEAPGTYGRRIRKEASRWEVPVSETPGLERRAPAQRPGWSSRAVGGQSFRAVPIWAPGGGRGGR